jgi:hypothetical protein
MPRRRASACERVSRDDGRSTTIRVFAFQQPMWML